MPKRGTLDVRYLIGVHADDARKMIDAAHCVVRVVEGDGSVNRITMDYVPIRVDLAVHRGVVTDVWVG